jgi:protein-tyrosine-phosphatase
MVEQNIHNHEKPSSVLFVCNHNSIRSPMAEAIAKELCGQSIFIDSVGVADEIIDINPFCISALEEIDIDLTQHKPKKIEDLNDYSFDLVVTLSPAAYQRVINFEHLLSAEIENWPTMDPSTTQGNRDLIMESFRELRTLLQKKLAERLT